MKFPNLTSSVAAAALLIGGAAYAQDEQTTQQAQGQGEQAQQQQAQGGQTEGDATQQQQAQGQQQDQQQDEQTQQQAQGESQQEGAQIHVSAADAREIEQTLNQEGFAAGEVDGDLSDAEEALRNFQRENGVAPTGQLTLETISALGVESILDQQDNEEQMAAAEGAEPTPLMVGPDVVRQVQQQLNQEGYDVGEVNGQWNDETSSAAENYLRDQGMTTSSNLNMALINALGIDLTGGGAGGQQDAQQAAGQGEGEEVQAVELYVAPDVVKQVKQSLADEGFSSGSIDAEWSDEARTALTNYLETEGMGGGEQLTTSSLAALGVDWRSGGEGGASGAEAEFTSGQSGGEVVEEGEIEVEVVE